MTDALDKLLAKPLEEVADNGFSAGVMKRIAAAQRRDEWLTYGVIALAALPLPVAVPWAEASAVVARLLPSLASAEYVAAAAALLALTFSFERLIRED